MFLKKKINLKNIGENMKFLCSLRKKCILFSFLFISCLSFAEERSAPRLAVVFVIDQFAHSYIEKVKPFLKGGIKYMLENGVVYNNAYYPHGMPSTATGHAAIATGCFAKDHGVIGNKWYDADGKMIYFPSDNNKEAAVFGRDGKSLKYGKSCKRMMVEGVSDQLILNPGSGATNYSFAISMKDRAAIALAGKLGKAVWYDENHGIFTSSKAYFKTVPAWLSEFNNEHKIYDIKSLKWEPAYYLKNNAAYDFKNARNYKFTYNKKGLIDTMVSLIKPLKKGVYGAHEKYSKFSYLPQANKALIDLSQKCLDATLKKANKQDKIILWISFSPLDKIGHLYGPNSLEALDMIYHVDYYIKRFIKRVYKRVRKKDVLFALTADHGVAPIPELLQQEGLKSARRVIVPGLVKQLNAMIDKEYGIKGLVVGFKSPQFFLKQKVFDALEKETQEKIVKDIKVLLLKHPGIKRVWSYDELMGTCFNKGCIGNFFKNQLYPGRSGYIIIQTFPYCQASKYKNGTGHRTPYEGNTHVPLMLFKKGELEMQEVSQRVNMLQFANTLAQIMRIPRSTASKFDVLPELFVTE